MSTSGTPIHVRFVTETSLRTRRRERTAEILADERVQAAQAARRGGRVREPQEAAAARSVVVTSPPQARVLGYPKGTKED